MKKSNYIATAICDGIKRYFTVHNVSSAHSTAVAKRVARSLFGAECVSILSMEIMN